MALIVFLSNINLIISCHKGIANADIFHFAYHFTNNNNNFYLLYIYIYIYLNVDPLNKKKLVTLIFPFLTIIFLFKIFFFVKFLFNFFQFCLVQNVFLLAPVKISAMQLCTCWWASSLLEIHGQYTGDELCAAGAHALYIAIHSTARTHPCYCTVTLLYINPTNAGLYNGYLVQYCTICELYSNVLSLSLQLKIT